MYCKIPLSQPSQKDFWWAYFLEGLLSWGGGEGFCVFGPKYHIHFFIILS